MNVLIDSVSCNPNVGSNAEAGYGFAAEASKRNKVFLLSHHELFHEGGNPLGADSSGSVSLHLLRPSIIRKLGRQADYTLRCYFHARRIVCDNAIDIVHTVEPTQYRMTRPLAFLGKVPFVLGPLNGGDAYPPKRFLEQLGQRRPFTAARRRSTRSLAGRIADAFNRQLVHGQVAQLSTRHAFKVARKIVVGTDNCLNNIAPRYHSKCAKVPCFGVDTRMFCQKESNNGGRAVILYAGRISAWKGLDLLVNAFAKICRGDTAVLKIAGSSAGDEDDERFEQYCRDTAASLGIARCVEFLGHVERERLVGLYQECDLFCLPSLWEPYGLVYLEAMACGKPVLAMASGGPKEIVTRHVGFTIEPKDYGQFIDDLAGALGTLIRDTNLRKQMGERARQHILDNYTWDVAGQKMQRVYEDAA